MTVLETLNWSTNYLKDHRIENPQLNAELLLTHALKFSRERLYISLDCQVNKEEKETLEGLIKRRISREPLQYILGHKEFWSIDLKVDHRVLIPRPETEVLVEESLSILFHTPSDNVPTILEIGTGSGAVAISLAREVRDISLVATDISGDALSLAKENAWSAGVLSKIQFVQASLFDPFRLLKGKEPFDLVLSNPPYIACSEIQRLAGDIREYEPIIALNGGDDGLMFYRSIVSQVPFYLKRGGWLLLEVGQYQGRKVSKLIQKRGEFLPSHCLPDLSGIERVVKAQKK